MGLFSKDIETFEQLFLHSLKDIYYAEKRIAETLPKLVGKASSRDLKRGLQNHLKETEGQIERLEEVFGLLGEEPKGTKCKGIEGILGEGDELIGNIADDKVLDAAIIGSAQAVEHYEITRYGGLIAWAEEVDRSDIAKILKATLKEEVATDKALSTLAEGKVNPKAEGKPARRRTVARRATKQPAGRKTTARRKSA